MSLPIKWINYSIYLNKWLGEQNEMMHIKPFAEYLVHSNHLIIGSCYSYFLNF